MFDALEWAYQHGFQCCDFVALDRQIAVDLLQGRPLTESQIKTRHFFHLGFGSEPLLLPEPRVCFGTAGFRLFYKWLSSFSAVRNRLKRLSS